MRLILTAAALSMLAFSAPAFAQTTAPGATTGGAMGTDNSGAAGMTPNHATQNGVSEGRATAPDATHGKGPGGSAAPGGGLNDATRNNGQ